MSLFYNMRGQYNHHTKECELICEFPDIQEKDIGRTINLFGDWLIVDSELHLIPSLTPVRGKGKKNVKPAKVREV